VLSRRAFFARATAAAVGALTLDPERLLWVPGQKMFFDLGVNLQDHTAWIQGLIDANGTVVLPAGTFRITAPLRIPHDRFVIGSPGPERTTLVWAGPPDGHMIEYPSWNH
jgi:hypothetical protein